jgi:hypothetical protein
VSIDLSNSLEFERLLNRLATDIVDAAIFNRLHTDISALADEFWQEQAQNHPFWVYTYHAHVEAVLLRLIRTYDKHTSALSLPSWLQTIKCNLHLFGAGHGAQSPDVIRRGAEPPDLEQLAQDIDSVTTADSLVKKLTSLRGNVIAHTNARNVVEARRLEDRFALTYEEINTLIARAETILNRYSILFNGMAYSSLKVGRDVLRNILKAVRADIERWDAERASEIERVTRAVSTDA